MNWLLGLMVLINLVLLGDALLRSRLNTSLGLFPAIVLGLFLSATATTLDDTGIVWLRGIALASLGVLTVVNLYAATRRRTDADQPAT